MTDKRSKRFVWDEGDIIVKPVPAEKEPATNSFPDHKGRPGKRGGSLPRSGGGAGGDDNPLDWERAPESLRRHPQYTLKDYHDLRQKGFDDKAIKEFWDHDQILKDKLTGEKLGDRVPEVVDNLAEKFGYDRRLVNVFPDTDPNKDFTVNGKNYHAAGLYYVETGEINLYDLDSKTEIQATGIFAHEVTHNKFHNFQDALEEQGEIINKSLRSSDNREDWLIKYDGSLRDPSDEKKFWAYETNRKFLSGDNYQTLKDSDGVTSYSTAYWEQAKSKRIQTKYDIDRAINETLAEISSLQAQADYDYSSKLKLDEVDPVWLDLHKRIFNAG